MPSSFRGLEQWERVLDGVANRQIDIRPCADSVHDQWLDDMAAGIDFTDVTGRLRRSLTNASSPDHTFKAQSDDIEMGSRDPASVFNPEYIPEVSSADTAEILRAWIFFGET